MVPIIWTCRQVCRSGHVLSRRSSPHSAWPGHGTTRIRLSDSSDRPNKTEPLVVLRAINNATRGRPLRIRSDSKFTVEGLMKHGPLFDPRPGCERGLVGQPYAG